ncbi:MAG: IclR family transcriptional regulator [Acidobacteriota bacterium]
MNNTVKKAFDIVRLVEKNQGKLTLSDIVRILEMNKTTVFRSLKTLEDLEILEKIDKFYYLGISLFELGNKVYLKQIIVEKIHPILKMLSEEVNETVNLAKLHNGMVLYLDKIESTRSLQIQSSIGDTLPLYCTSLGKSILSILPEEETEKIFDSFKFKKFTQNTIINKKSLIKQIEKVKDRGFSVDEEEFEEGLVCVSVPLFLKEHSFYGGLSLSGPSIRFTQKNINIIASRLKEYKKLILNKINS